MCVINIHIEEDFSGSVSENATYFLSLYAIAKRSNNMGGGMRHKSQLVTPFGSYSIPRGLGGLLGPRLPLILALKYSAVGYLRLCTSSASILFCSFSKSTVTYHITAGQN